MDRQRLAEIEARAQDGLDQCSEDCRWLIGEVNQLWQLSLDLVHALLED